MNQISSDQPCITSDPRQRWGTPCLRDTGISVGHVVALRQAGNSTGEILAACPELTAADVDAALEWYREGGDEAIRPRPPRPGDRHPRIAVDPTVQGGHPTVRGTRITVDAIVGMWEHGFTEGQILAEYPTLTHDDVADAIAYDSEVGA